MFGQGSEAQTKVDPDPKELQNPIPATLQGPATSRRIEEEHAWEPGIFGPVYYKTVELAEHEEHALRE